MDIVNRFLNYVSFNTQSDEKRGDADITPSSDGQMVFAKYLKEELERIGLEDICLDSNGYLYATLPANIEKDLPVIGFIAHMDTSPDCSGENIKPRIIEKYDGKDIVLDAENGIKIETAKFPELLNHIDEDIIVTNGHTLLGADDKSGIAAIVSAMEYLMAHPEIKHGKIRVAFNPDEEIGLGAHKFDVKLFGCDWAYTMDGSEVGELEFENFNAASATIQIKGMSVHPGYSKNKMINAALIASEFISMMPKAETPQRTEGYEGFYHLTSIKGNVEEATISYIIRDHSRAKFEQRKVFITSVADFLAKKYGKNIVTIEVKDQYYNMREKVEPVYHIIENAMKAMEDAGITPRIQPIRGGTDGAQLSFKGLPCPNIFAGGINFHGPLEFLPIPSLQKAMQVVINLCKIK
ncbi:MAG: peptidase T [Prevotellaceae bacterium]|nr:peptidase T [Candidatus Faecinaster equi]